MFASLSKSCAVLATIVIGIAAGSSSSTHHKIGDSIDTKVSNVAPFRNPTEKYKYDWLPWPCRTHAHVSEGMGAWIDGERLRDSLYQIRFRTQTEKQSLCGEKTIDAKHVDAFINAIKNEFQYEMWIDDLPLFGKVGFAQTDPTRAVTEYYLITHRHFDLRYNKDQVITANISTRLPPDHYIRIEPKTPVNVHFSYSVSWTETDIPYADRWTVQSASQPSKYQVEEHWLWVMNSAIFVVFLTGLLSRILLRTLKNDVARYLQVDQIDAEEYAEARKQGLDHEVDDSGWKRIRFDVFRPPNLPFVFSSIVGVGAQILMITFFLLCLAAIGWFYPGNHGRIYVAAIVLYSFTAYVAGYIASSKLKEIAPEQHDWMISCGLTASMFAGPFIVIFAIVNSVAVYHESSVALPFATILAIILIWAFVTFPLTAFGAFRGGNVAIEEYPCHVEKINPLPAGLPWYHNSLLLATKAGFLSFSTIYFEVHTIFMSVWGQQPYTLFGILLLTFVILLIVTAFVVILMCYFQLRAGDYRWWWESVFRGSACGVFTFAYAIYYWAFMAQMSGTLQFCMYFGYTLMLSYAFCLMLAAVGHWASRWFVIRIYKAIKSD